MYANADELVVRVADVCSYKWNLLKRRPLTFFLSAFAGGAFVGFGAMLALSVSTGASAHIGVGPTNLLMGLAFMFSLVIILFSGMSLVTADMAIGIIGIFHRRITWGGFSRMLVLCYLGNFTGSMCFLWLLSKGGSYQGLSYLLRSHAMGVAKTGMSATQIFALGIVCTWTLQTAALLFIKAENEVSKILIAAYGPLAFVAGMAEHCIANIGFLALPLFQQDLYLKAAGEVMNSAPVILHWGFGQYGWAHNQLFTVLGNLIGGIVFAGIVFQLVSDPDRVAEIYKNKKEFIARL